MAFTHLPTLTTLFFLLLSASTIRANVDDPTTTLQLTTDALHWPSMMSLYDGTDFGEDEEEEKGGPPDGGAIGRRSLFWRTMRYYISYGALAANRIPCPPRSGRSYYTHNCYKARGPVHPYSRGCSAITRCRR